MREGKKITILDDDSDETFRKKPPIFWNSFETISSRSVRSRADNAIAYGKNRPLVEEPTASGNKEPTTCANKSFGTYCKHDEGTGWPQLGKPDRRRAEVMPPVATTDQANSSPRELYWFLSIFCPPTARASSRQHKGIKTSHSRPPREPQDHECTSYVRTYVRSFSKRFLGQEVSSYAAHRHGCTRFFSTSSHSKAISHDARSREYERSFSIRPLAPKGIKSGRKLPRGVRTLLPRNILSLQRQQPRRTSSRVRRVPSP